MWTSYPSIKIKIDAHAVHPIAEHVEPSYIIRKGPGYFCLACPQCQEEKYEQYVTRRLAAENREPFPTDPYANYKTEVQKAVEEKRILRPHPTPITWCIRCNQERCKEGCGSALFEREPATLRSETPVAAPAEEGYSSSETIWPRGVLYSTALVRKIETRNKAVQTGRPRTRNRATQTEAEALHCKIDPFLASGC